MSIELVDQELCNGCGLCVITCPLDVIRLDTVVSDRDEHPPCRQACPVGVDVRRYMNLLKDGQVDEAIEVLRDFLPLPAVIAEVSRKQFIRQSISLRTPSVTFSLNNIGL